jgi:hypothetical protein
MLLFAASYANTADDILIKVIFDNDGTTPLIESLWIE